MSNHQGRSCIPTLRKLLTEAGYEQSAVGLARLKAEKAVSYPSSSIFQHVVYDKRLVRRPTAESVIKLFEGKLPTVANDLICDFDHDVEGFGPLMNQLRSRRDFAREDIYQNLADASGYGAPIIRGMEKGKLVPEKVCHQVRSAVQQAFSVSIEHLRTRRALHNDQQHTPLPQDSGRIDVLDRLFPERNI